MANCSSSMSSSPVFSSEVLHWLCRSSYAHGLSWNEQAKINACSVTLPHLRDAQALLREEKRKAPVFQCNDMRDMALLWRDAMHKVQPILRDDQCYAPALSGCQHRNPTSTRKRSYPKSNP
ncbi:hypothetical protein HAX54_013758 [Datura stramonium]|uniref:Uncharacterized protein n=1 Tax=Datura stramonium TaxID=4076 RepID=A0ABS8TNK1_DATST|nr:hypothetical protein [Datura stramonium]